VSAKTEDCPTCGAPDYRPNPWLQPCYQITYIHPETCIVCGGWAFCYIKHFGLPGLPRSQWMHDPEMAEMLGRNRFPEQRNAGRCTCESPP
jgi:hypothetical protein